MKRTSFSMMAVLFFMAFSVSQAFAEVKLPSIFCDNMVMQQQTEAAIWGKATKNSTVKVSTSWNGKSYSTQASADGSVRVLPPR